MTFVFNDRNNYKPYHNNYKPYHKTFNKSTGFRGPLKLTLDRHIIT